jgi:anti-sigma B factor antagonist
MTDQIDVETEFVDGATVLRPKGDVDLSRAPSLREKISAAQRDQPDRLIIDLGEVPYMDSSGVATLVEALQVARRTGGKLVLCNLHEKVRSIFEIARLDMVFAIAADLDAARQA